MDKVDFSPTQSFEQLTADIISAVGVVLNFLFVTIPWLPATEPKCFQDSALTVTKYQINYKFNYLIQ